MFSALKTAAKGYSLLSGTVGAVLHPVDTLRAAMRESLVSGIKAVVLVAVGPSLTADLMKRAGGQQAFSHSIPVPDVAQSYLLDPEFLSSLNTAVNDALAAPLAVLGLRVGAVRLAPKDGALLLEGCLALSSGTAQDLLPPAQA